MTPRRSGEDCRGRGSGDHRPAQGVRKDQREIRRGHWSDDQMNKLLERQGQVQESWDAQVPGTWTGRPEMAMDALRCPPGVYAGQGPLRRRGRLSPSALLLQNPTFCFSDEPTNHLDAETVGSGSKRHLQQYPGTVIAVTHDRIFWTTWRLDPGAGPGRGSPGKEITPPGWTEENPPATEEKAETPPEDPSSGSWSGSACPQARQPREGAH